MNTFSDQQIIDSWKLNVVPWITAIRKKQIESRQLITNKAILDAISCRNPKTVLDAGCGEGWLVRELTKSGIDALGIDAVPELVRHAQAEGGGRYKAISYEGLSHNSLNEKFDIVVCNFSLIGDTSVMRLFQQVPALLNKDGSFIVQTIHPIACCGNEGYEDGWREGSWAGFSNEFCSPAPWYFRTIESWKNLFLDNKFKLCTILEPINIKTNMPASIIFIGTLNN